MRVIKLLVDEWLILEYANYVNKNYMNIIISLIQSDGE